MTYRVEDIVYENGSHWVLRTKVGFEVYRSGITHSTRRGSFGRGDEYMKRAIAHADSLEAVDKERA